MKETPKAQTGFEDYWAMGPERSLPKLCQLYIDRVQGETELRPPTVRIATLKKWSAEHNWQARIIDRIQVDAAEVRQQLQERAIDFGKRIAGAIEIDVTRWLSKLKLAPGQPMMAESAVDVDRLVKLFYQIAEKPLSDKIEHTGMVGLRTVLLPVFSEDDPLFEKVEGAGDD